MPRNFLLELLCAPADEGGGGAGDGGAGADAGAGDGGGAGDDGGAGAGGGNGGGSGKWFEDDRFKADSDFLAANGLTVDDPLDAIVQLSNMEKAAQQKLGKSADQLLVKPEEGKEVADWLRENGNLFGIPESAEAYKIEKPADWPKDAAWDSEFETAARALAYEQGLSQSAVQKLTELYAGRMQSVLQKATDDQAAALQALNQELQRDWGAQFEARKTLANQAASVVFEKAGLDETAKHAMAELFKDKIGDANTVRIFAAIGQMMGDDPQVFSGGGSGLTTTPAEARQQLAQLQSEGGDYYKAVASRNDAEIERLKPEIERLTKLAAG